MSPYDNVIAGSDADPMRVIDRMYGPRRGPIDARARAGLMPEQGEISARVPTVTENIIDALRQWLPEATVRRIAPVVRAPGSILDADMALENAILNYGPLPAKAYVDEAAKAADAVTRTIEEPSLPNAGNAAVRTLMVAGAPVRSGLAAAGAYGLTGLTDLVDSMAGPARAADPQEIERRLRSMSPAAIKALQRDLGVPEDGVAGGRTLNAMLARETEKERSQSAERADRLELEKTRASAAAEGEAKVRSAGVAAAAETERARIASEARKSADQARRVEEAKRQLLQDLTAARTPAVDRSLTGQLYDELGLLTPTLGAMGAGAAARMAFPQSKFLMPALAGMDVGGTLAMAPLWATAARPDQTNPEHRAWQSYVMSLPIEAQDEINRAAERLGSTPRIDPAVSAARDKLNDPLFRAQALGLGALGGMSGYITAAGAGKIPEKAGEIAGRFREGWHRGQGRADAAQAARPQIAAGAPLQAANAGAGPGHGPGAPGAGGGAVQPGPQQGPPPAPPGGQAPAPQFARYEEVPGPHGQVSRQYLDDWMTSNQGSRNQPLQQPDLVENIARNIEAKYHVQGLPAVDPKALRERVQASVDQLAHGDAIRRAGNSKRTGFAPEVRQEMLDASIGRSGMLAVPGGIVAGGAAMAPDGAEAAPVDFRRLLSDYRRVVIDMDGDGRPDAVVEVPANVMMGR